MRAALAVLSLALLSVRAVADPYVGAYVLINPEQGVQKLQALAANAETLPFNRLWISFFSPTMVYVPGSKTLEHTGLNLATSGDFGYSVLHSAIATLEAGGVETFLSLGGWDSSCFPGLYTYESVGGYGTNTPNYFKIPEYSSNGQLSGCTESNMWCYTCEPPSQNTTLASFSVFPMPVDSPTWKQAVQFVVANAKQPSTTWNTSIVPGTSYTDPSLGLSFPVPGSSLWQTMGRDPYADIVTLASELGASGIDLDWEEFWMADTFKEGPSTGPWTSFATVYKYSVIAYDLIQSIKNTKPSLKLSTAAPATGAWAGNWWGGNLKSLQLYVAQWYPFISEFMTVGPNAGGINVMTYDLSDNMEYSECPEPTLCTLDQQVNYYMATYLQANIPAGVGYETAQPAYPDPTHDPQNQLPLTSSALALILANTQPQFQGAFFWEAFKVPTVADEVTPTQLSQALCKALLSGATRCSGSIPAVPSA